MEDDELVFMDEEEEEEELAFSPEDDEEAEPSEIIAKPRSQSSGNDSHWNVLIVDDDKDVVEITKVTLSKFSFMDKKLKLFQANSGAEAKEKLQEIPDLALVLLDVVMETNHAGLEVVKFIRNQMQNHCVRIILRTGQPGQAPETDVITNYDINDYKEKGELTYQKLFNSVITSLRSFRDINTIERTQKELADLVDTLEEKVEERTKQVKDILNNVQSGVLICDQDAKIQPGYTKSCQNIFGQEKIEDLSLPDLMSEKPKWREGFMVMYKLIFEDEFMPELYVSQLPDRFTREGRTYSIIGKMLLDNEEKLKSIMFTIVDITEEEKAQEEIRKNQTLIEILKSKEEFIRFIDHIKGSFQKASDFEKAGDQTEVRKILHTIKGTTGCYGLKDIAAKVHEVEELEAINANDIDSIELKLVNFLKDSFPVLTIDYQNPEEKHLKVSREEISKLETKLSEVKDLDQLSSFINQFIKKLQFEEAIVLFGGNAKLIQRLGEKCKKPIQLQTSGDHIKMDPDILIPIFSNISHLIRNSIDHGIEDGPDRGDKPETATISIDFKEESDKWTIVFTDDGRGIDGDKLLQKALDKGIVTAEQANEFSDKEKLELIFHAGFSTKEQVSTLSGRGVGMSAVKSSIEEANGTLEVNSQVGVGTTFTISIPRS